MPHSFTFFAPGVRIFARLEENFFYLCLTLPVHVLTRTRPRGFPLWSSIVFQRPTGEDRREQRTRELSALTDFPGRTSARSCYRSHHQKKSRRSRRRSPKSSLRSRRSSK